MKPRLAIFDLDGSLADSFPWFLVVVNDVADRFGFRRVEEHEVDTIRGYDARRRIRHLRTPAWKLPFIARHVRARMAADIHRIPLFPGVDGLLRALHGHGVTIAIATSSSEASVRRVLGPQNAALVRHYGCGVSILGKANKLRRVLYAVGWGYTHAAALAEHGPDAVFTAMDELAGALTSGTVPRS